MTQERIEAAAKAEYESEMLLLDGRWEEATPEARACFRKSTAVGLAAADAVMFSDEAIERAARELARHRWQDAINVWDSLGQDAKDGFRDQARIVVAALKGDA